MVEFQLPLTSQGRCGSSHSHMTWMFVSFTGETSQDVTVSVELGGLCLTPHELVGLCSPEAL